MEITEFKSQITNEQYNAICTSTSDYIHTFQSSESSDALNYSLKAEHSQRVIGYIELLCNEFECTDSQLNVAKTIALLHDIGRFEQYREFRTFYDDVSFDHAQLAVNIIEKQNWIGNVNDYTATVIKTAVFNHNKLAISKELDKEETFYCKLIRDADKLDIFDMSIKEYNMPGNSRNKSFTLDLEDSQKVSQAVVKSILAGKLPEKKDLKTVSDFKVMQLGFVFDLNFKKSFVLVNNKQYLKQLFATLPKSDEVFEMYRKAKIHVENQLI